MHGATIKKICDFSFYVCVVICCMTPNVVVTWVAFLLCFCYVWDSSALTPAALIEVFLCLFSLPPSKFSDSSLSYTTDSSLQIHSLFRRFELTCCFYLMRFKSITLNP